MPHVNVQITAENNTREQKAEVIRGITQVLVDVLGKNPETTVVIIEEVALENWGMAGLQADDYRRQAAARG